MVKKKSYNPFKIWGSYVGGAFLALYSLISVPRNLFDFADIWIILGGTIHPGFLHTFVFLSHSILGFLIGWIIHSLFRRFS